MSYFDDLQSPLWQRKRLKIMERDNWRCCLCGTDKNSLTVHHLYYASSKKPYEYDDDALVTLCKDCHATAHNEISKISSLIAFSVLRERKDFIEVNECLKNGGII